MFNFAYSNVALWSHILTLFVECLSVHSSI
jgi:hypothetical protein